MNSSSTDDSLDNSPDNDNDDDDQAHSFRKRRLTLTKHHLQNAASAAATALLDNDDDDSSSLSSSDNVGDKRKQHGIQYSPPPPSKRIKHDETIRTSSSATRPLDDSLRKRILHAGEITRKHIPATTATTTHHNHQTQTKWRRRFSFTSNTTTNTDTTSLPFPLHIVGSYSCHGMEPVYDSDDSHGSSSSSADNNRDLNTTAKDSIIAKINQDRGGIAYPYCRSEHCAFFGVFDGHGEGGEMVSQYALGEVQRLLEERLLNGGCWENTSSREEEECLIKDAFRDTFVKVDRGLLNESDIEPMYSGTTACVVLLRNNKLYISNAGDSRAVLARRSVAKNTNMSITKQAASTINKSTNASTQQLITMPLSVDQNPDSPGEQERILNKGGFVSPPPEQGLSARVWLDAEYTQIGLAMARSIGDHAVKDVGVTAEPVVTVHDVVEDDEFFILATDGVWEFIESEEAVSIVSKHLYCGDIGNNCASKACEALIEAAMAKWKEYEGHYRDDITAIIVRLKDVIKHH